MPSANPDRTEFSDHPDKPEAAARPSYTIVFVGDLAAAGRLGHCTTIDKDSFADVIGRARPEIAVELQPPVGESQPWEFRLAFGSLSAFEPAGLLAQVPRAAPRLRSWQGLRQRRRGKISAAEAASIVTEAVRADSGLAWLPAALEGVDQRAAGGPLAPAPGSSVLDLVEEPDQKRRVAADVERLASAVPERSTTVSAQEGQRLDQALGRLERELGSIAEALLKHPDVRRVEAAWRAAKFLVDRLDFRSGVRLMLVDAPREHAVARLNEEVIEPAFSGEAPTPGLVLFDYPIENTPVDLAVLDELARCVAGLPVPAAFPIEPAFFGVKSAGLIKNLPNLSGLVDGWQFAKWRSLREQPYSRWVAAVLGHFVLRPPYEALPDATDFTCTESISAASQLLWAGGHLAMGVCAARAFDRHGWPTRMFGAEAGKLEDLPIVPNPADAQKPWGPGDLVLPDRRLDELPAVGMNVLQSMPGKDYCILLGGLTVAKPVTTAEIGKQQATLETSLAYQQFSSIVGAWLCEQATGLRGLAGDEIQKRLVLGLRDLMRLTAEDPDETVLVGVGSSPGDSTRTVVQVRVTPPARIVPGGLHVDFGFHVSS